jgi:hypothetical protein
MNVTIKGYMTQFIEANLTESPESLWPFGVFGLVACQNSQA